MFNMKIIHTYFSENHQLGSQSVKKSDSQCDVMSLTPRSGVKPEGYSQCDVMSLSPRSGVEPEGYCQCEVMSLTPRSGVEPESYTPEGYSNS